MVIDPSASQPTPAPIGAGPVSELPEDAIEARRAARTAAVEALNVIPGSQYTYPKSAAWTIADAAVAAALPFLERALRAKIAAEIEHVLWNFEEPFTRLPAMAAAARVARGGEATE